MTNMTTEELVKALRDPPRSMMDFKRMNEAASIIERQAEAIRVLRDMLYDVAARMEGKIGLISGAERARGILAQTKEFGE